MSATNTKSSDNTVIKFDDSTIALLLLENYFLRPNQPNTLRSEYTNALNGVNLYKRANRYFSFNYDARNKMIEERIEKEVEDFKKSLDPCAILLPGDIDNFRQTCKDSEELRGEVFDRWREFRTNYETALRMGKEMLINFAKSKLAEVEPLPIGSRVVVLHHFGYHWHGYTSGRSSPTFNGVHNFMVRKEINGGLSFPAIVHRENLIVIPD